MPARDPSRLCLRRARAFELRGRFIPRTQLFGVVREGPGDAMTCASASSTSAEIRSIDSRAENASSILVTRSNVRAGQGSNFEGLGHRRTVRAPRIVEQEHRLRNLSPRTRMPDRELVLLLFDAAFTVGASSRAGGVHSCVYGVARQEVADGSCDRLGLLELEEVAGAVDRVLLDVA
jgi:hypothetical protein